MHPLFHLLLLVIVTSHVGAVPLQPAFSSCLSSFTPLAPQSTQFNISEVYADLISGAEASQLGLAGQGHSVLRVDLLGSTDSAFDGYDNDTNKLATLFTETTTAGFNVWTSSSWICDSLFPSILPQPYSQNTTYCPFSPGRFGINISIPLWRSYALTTLHTRIRLVDSSDPAETLSCIDMNFTPYRHSTPSYSLFLGLPIALAIGYWIASWGARFAAGWVIGSGVAEYEQKEAPAKARRDGMMRKWGTMIISGLSGERLSVSGGLLRFVTPSLRDIIHHIQFCTILGMVAVGWPTFAYPIFAQGAWADLVWNVTLVQGSNTNDRVSPYATDFTPSSDFAAQISDSSLPLYLDPSTPDRLLNLYDISNGMRSFAFAVGLRPQDLFGTCLAIFLLITLAVCLVSLFLWFLHGLFEFFTVEPRGHSKRYSRGNSPHDSLGGKETYATPAMSDGPGILPTQASLTQTLSGQQLSFSNKLRKTWWRFRLKGEAGAFHAAALYGNLVRLIILFHLPITTFSMFQLVLGHEASVVSRVFAALAFIFISVIIPAFLLFKISRTPTGKLYDATRTLLSLGPMYNVYVEEKQMFRIFPLSASLITGIVVGAGQKSGLAQAVVLILVELAMLIIPAVYYPWGEGASMGAPSAFLGLLRVVSVVLVMLLSPNLSMTRSADDWIAYSIFILQAIAFVFFALMLITKVVEGLIRLFGSVHFDESTSPLDGGIFAAIMDLDCLNGVRGGKAAARRRRKRGSKQLQRNVSAAGSLTTQMMLDRHSQGIPRQPVSETHVPFLQSPTSPGPQTYFPGYHSPLGPPPMERLSSDSRSEERTAEGHIMDAWSPPHSPPHIYQGYAPPGNYVPSATSPDGGKSFHVISGGRAEMRNPYIATGPGRIQSPSPVSASGPKVPTHSRTWSASAAQHGGFNSPPPSSSTLLSSSLYPPGHTSNARPNSQGLRPPILAIPKRRSLNNLKEVSPTSRYGLGEKERDKESKRKQKQKRRSKPIGWFMAVNKGESSGTSGTEEDEESDDEPGPSRRRKHKRMKVPITVTDELEMREPEPFQPIPAIVESGGAPRGWKATLGLVKRRKEEDESVRDENKARKAALATESGALFAGVQAPKTQSIKTPTPTTTGFKVKRAGRPSVSPISPISTDELSMLGQIRQESVSSFKVKRPGSQPEPKNIPPTVVARPSNLTPVMGGSTNTVRFPQVDPQKAREEKKEKSEKKGKKKWGLREGKERKNEDIENGEKEKEKEVPKRSFKVLRHSQPPSISNSFTVNRPLSPPVTQSQSPHMMSSLTPGISVTAPDERSAESSLAGDILGQPQGYKAVRPQEYGNEQSRGYGNEQFHGYPSIGNVTESSGYPLSAIVPINEVSRQKVSNVLTVEPPRPPRDPRRSYDRGEGVKSAKTSPEM